MFEVGLLVLDDEADDRLPQPRGRVEVGRPFLQVAPPGEPHVVGHLSPVRPPDHEGQVTGGAQRLAPRELLDLQLQVFRQQLAHDDRPFVEVRRRHAVTEVGRHRPCAGHDALGVVGRHRGGIGRGRDGGHGFLDVDQRQLVLSLTREVDEGGVAELAERGTPLHPVGGIEQFDLGFVRTLVEGQDQALHGGGVEQHADIPLFLVAQAQERLADRNGGANVGDALAGEVPPLPAERLLADGGDEFRLADRVRVLGREEAGLVAADHLLQHARRRHAREVRAPRRAGERQGQPDEVVGRVADHGLVEVTDLDVDLALAVGDRSEVAGMAVAADPNGRAVREAAIDLG